MFYWLPGGDFGGGVSNNAFLEVLAALNRPPLETAVEPKKEYRSI
jgi:hypothetical protein